MLGLPIEAGRRLLERRRGVTGTGEGARLGWGRGARVRRGRSESSRAAAAATKAILGVVVEAPDLLGTASPRAGLLEGSMLILLCSVATASWTAAAADRCQFLRALSKFGNTCRRIQDSNQNEWEVPTSWSLWLVTPLAACSTLVTRVVLLPDNRALLPWILTR